MEVYRSALPIFIVDNFTHHLYIQGCGLRKILRSPKVPNHEILGAQHLSLYEKMSFSSRPKSKLDTCGTQALQEHSPDITNVVAFTL